MRSFEPTSPPTINDAATTQQLRDVFTANFGDDILYEEPRTGMGAEDFAYFVTPESGVKGVYFAVGGTPEKEVESAPSHHSPFFKIEPEPSIKVATEAMVVGAMALMKKEYGRRVAGLFNLKGYSTIGC